MTWENTTNCSPTTQVITGRVLLLICGFGVQVPGGAPRLTWPFTVLGPPAAGASEAQVGQMRAIGEQRSHASRRWSENCGYKVRRGQCNVALPHGTSHGCYAPIEHQQTSPTPGMPD